MKMSKPQIRVLLSAYNGEKYIVDQVNSILNQEEVEVFLTIRIDGGTDNTYKLLKEKYNDFDNIEIINGKNIGVRKSFLTLLTRYYNQDYFAFADQDDVWDNKKLITGINAIRSEVKPAIYFSSLKYVDSNLNFIKLVEFDKDTSIFREISRHSSAGCTYVFNKCFYDLCQQIDVNVDLDCAHDMIIPLVCLINGGKLVYDKNSYINFRRHESNVSSAGNSFKKKLKKHLRYFTDRKNFRSQLVSTIFSIYKDNINNEMEKQLLPILNYRKKKFSRIKLAFSKCINSGSYIYNCFLRTLCLLGKF